MKSFYTVLLAPILSLSLMATPATAENIMPPSNLQMQQFMMMMQQMQQCLAQMDEDEVTKYQHKVQALEQNLKTLCQAGKRDEAQTQAITFAEELNQSAALKHIQQCTRMVQENAFMPSIPLMDIDVQALKKQNICDRFNFNK